MEDPYRWLEDAASEETAAWSAAEERLAREYLDALPCRARFAARVAELLPGFVSAPVTVGSRRFFLRRLVGEDHPVLVVAEEGSDPSSARPLLDPSALSPDHTVTLEGFVPSPDGSLVACALGSRGTEDLTLQVVDLRGGLAEAPIRLGRSFALVWTGDAEYVYVRRLPDAELPEGDWQFHRRVYRRRVGDPEEHDTMLFGEGRDRATYYGLGVSFDRRWLVVEAAVGTAPRNDVYLADLRADRLVFVPVLEGVDARASVRVGRDGRLYVLTDLGAPRGRLAVCDPSDPVPSSWQDLVPEGEAVLEAFALAGSRLLAASSKDAHSRVSVHDRSTGALLGELALPGAGSADLIGREDEAAEAFVGYTDHVTPYRVLRYDAEDGSLEPFADPPGWEAVPGMRSTQVFATSPDGTSVPAFVVFREPGPDPGPGATKDSPDGPRPTVLTGYGGFGVSLTPAYSASAAAWVEAGGVFVSANLRGGGEYGEQWHRAGMREHKQAVFDDFMAVAQHLVAAGWTDARHLGILGGSNGGLLVGAVLTQHPEAFAAAVAEAPLLDMVRYERFGLGVTWNDEYGSADDPEQLGWLVSYSPYHHVVAGTRYPATLLAVFESDTRVDPFHARKMAAALQWATSASFDEAPVLLRVERDVGHGARSVGRSVGLSADVLAFLARHTGLAC